MRRGLDCTRLCIDSYSLILTERLFQPFGKEDEESGGVGLSLSICQHLTAQLSGRIVAESIVGQGTKMTVSLPLKKSGKSGKVDMSISKRKVDVPVAFLGFETYSKRLFVEKFVKQFRCRETKSLQAAQIVIISMDETHLQVDCSKEMQILQDREQPAEVIMMPAVCLAELDEIRADRLEELVNQTGQQTQIFERPMNFARIKEFALLLQVVRNRQMMMASDSVLSEIIATANAAEAPPAYTLGPCIGNGAESVRRGSELSDQMMQSDHPFTVLVVEDNPLNARIMTTMLKRAKIEYYLAKDGREGVELFEKHLPILVLLDINMPIMNGFEACELMRKAISPYNHRIIAITALSTEAEKRKGRECGMDDWLTKPTRMNPLLRDIQRE